MYDGGDMQTKQAVLNVNWVVGKLRVMAAIRLISIMFHNNKLVKGMKIVFMENRDWDISVLQKYVILWYSKNPRIRT